MTSNELLDAILLNIRLVKGNPKELEKILDFILSEVNLPEEEKPSEEMDEEEENVVQIPERYNKAVKEIAGNIDAGLVCFLRTDTLEIDQIPYELFSDSSTYKMNTGFTLKDFKPKYTRWKKYITIEPLVPNESFKIMEKFVHQLDNSRLRTQLVHALQNRKPFANFKYIIDNSEIRQDWFDFKDKKLQEYVSSMIEINIPDELISK
jgi:DNA-binding ferritin-like protein (Dps family)